MLEQMESDITLFPMEGYVYSFPNKRWFLFCLTSIPQLRRLCSVEQEIIWGDVERSGRCLL
jgi:hypothetical protein